MTAFRLHKVTSHPNDQDTYRVILTLDDGYNLEAGGIKSDTGSNQRVFWAWSIGVLRKISGIIGQCGTREEAMERFRAAWDSIVTTEDVSEMRHQAEWTAQKYALWDAGYRSQMAAGAVHCPCGETFNPRDFEATKAHIGHITGRDD